MREEKTCRRKRWWMAALAILVLATALGCGGGGGGDKDDPRTDWDELVWDEDDWS